MEGEQPVYLNLSPEESLTSVHERLEKLPGRRVILIVPQQTQLRSLTSWRLLRGYADELDKEIFVISADRQVRSVAREAQFRVAESLAVPASAKGRGGNPSRRGGISAMRGSSNRGAKGTPRLRQSPYVQQSPTSSRRPNTGPTSRMMRSPLPEPLSTEQETDELHISNVGDDDEPESTTMRQVSPPFGTGQSSHYEQPFDFSVASKSPLRPVEPTPEPEDEELDSFPYYYEQSQKIFQAARQKDEVEGDTTVIPGPDRMAAPQDRVATPPTEEQSANENSPKTARPSSPLSPSLSPSAEALEDPFAVLDDFQPLPLSEQRGTAPVRDFDYGEDVVDISEHPTTDIPVHGEIEDLGDMDMDELPPLADELPSAPPWEEPDPEALQEEEDDLPRAPYRPRSGQLSPAAMGTTAFNAANPDEEELIEDEPTRVIPPALSLPDAVAGQSSGRMAPGRSATGKQPAVYPTQGRKREPSPVDLQPTRASARSATVGKRRPILTAIKRPVSLPRSLKPFSVTQRRGEQEWLRSVLIAVALLLLVGIIFFVFPSADVTATLAAKPYSWPIVVSASTSQNLSQHTVPLYTTSFTASVTKTGQASGTNTPVGTAKATGIVEFTNNGTQSVVIPSGTVISTASNVSFETTAEAVVTGKGGVNFVPVQAQAPGTSGNVAANSITVIPASSLSQIEQVKENQGVTTVKLSVTNPNPTRDGGVGSATTVTKNDVSKLQSDASNQLYQELQAWLMQKQAQGNVLARPVQASQLGSYETVKSTPAAGQVASNGSFSETVSLSMPVQFVHSSDLQAQAVTQYHQLPAGVKKPPQGYEPVAGQPVQLKATTCPSASKPSTLCFTATAPVALPITAQQVQNLVNGRQVKVVRAQLANSTTGLAGIKSVKVNVSPSFWPWMPFWTQRISVHFTTDSSQK
jgi:Baseplate J-like protein